MEERKEGGEDIEKGEATDIHVLGKWVELEHCTYMVVQVI